MKGEHLTEMASMKDTGIVVGFTDDGLPVMNSLLMRRALEYAGDLNLPVAQHAEDIVLTNGGCIAEGAVATKLGVRGISNATEAIIVERDLLLLELTGGSYHVLHISTRQSIEAVRRAKAKGLDVTCEASPHHFTLTVDAVLEHGSNAKMNPPLRSEDDRQAVLEGLKDGTIDAIATDHAPHDAASKDLPLSKAAFGIVGVETMLPLSLNLVRDGTLSLHDMLGKMTYKAADIVREPSGRLQKGARADLTLFNPDIKWVCDESSLSSLSKNTPFIGQTMQGRATRTVVGGKTVYTL
jgi:dihydroorotase